MCVPEEGASSTVGRQNTSASVKGVLLPTDTAMAVDPSVPVAPPIPASAAAALAVVSTTVNVEDGARGLREWAAHADGGEVVVIMVDAMSRRTPRSPSTR